MYILFRFRCQETSDEDSECISSSTAELVMDNSVSTTTATPVTTIEHCSTKGFPPTPPSSPQDLINNNSNQCNPLTKHGSFGSTIISTNNDGDLEPNNELKSPAVNRQQLQQYDCGGLESSSGSMPDADLTESLATATEALTEILVKTNLEREIIRNNGSGAAVVVVVVQDDNGNENVLSPQFHSTKQHHAPPNVSSSSTQTELPSSSYRVCCCNNWNRWKSATTDNKRDRSSSVRCLSPSGGGASDRRCCHHHHRRKKTNATTAASNRSGGNESSSSSSGETKAREKKVPIVTAVSTKYSKSWRELRKATSADGKRSAEVVICRLQTTRCCNTTGCGSVKPM